MSAENTNLDHNHNLKNGEHDKEQSKSEDGRIQLQNPHLKELKFDKLYHLGFSTNQNDFVQLFNDVKFVITGGKCKRMKTFAHLLAEELNLNAPSNIIADSNRFSMYKVGPVLAVSHGMGIPSLSILMHEMIKLIHYAKCTNVNFIRVGTCGGIGVPPGTLILTEKAVDEMMNPWIDLNILGKRVRRYPHFSKKLIKDIKETAEKDKFNIVVGKTMCAMDFYEAQARMDGAICTFTKTEQQEYLKKLKENGVVNIEMEATAFGMLCKEVGIPCAIVCVSLVDRMLGDQVTLTSKEMSDSEKRLIQLIINVIKRKIQA